MEREPSVVSELRLLRERAGLSQHELARKAKVTPRFWSFELKRSAPPARVIYNLAKALAYELYPELEGEEFEQKLFRIAFYLLEDAAQINAEKTGQPLLD